MMRIATFVFVDLEPTGLPKEELNKTKIVELGMVAVSRDHLLATRQGARPRVQDKLNLCFNPQKPINPVSTLVTGLDNDLVEQQTAFNTDVCDLINKFLKLLPKPVCLIAHNGMIFDFPIIKNHFDKLSMSLAEDVMCADCYHGFYDILEAKKKVEEKILNSTINEIVENESSDTVNVVATGTLKEKNRNDDFNPSTNLECSKPKNEALKVNVLEQNISITYQETENINLESVTLEFTKDFTEIEAEELRREKIKSSNETTPKQTLRQSQPPRLAKGASRLDKVRRRFPFSIDNKPKDSYKLKNIYQRLLNRTAHDAHRAESDCIYALEIAVVLSEQFVLWVDNNCCFFSDVKPMTQGVPIGL